MSKLKALEEEVGGYLRKIDELNKLVEARTATPEQSTEFAELIEKAERAGNDLNSMKRAAILAGGVAVEQAAESKEIHKMVRNFKLTDAINTTLAGGKIDGVAAEFNQMAQQENRASGIEPVRGAGFSIPMAALRHMERFMQKRDGQVVGVSADGGNSVPTLIDPELTPYLYNNLAVMQCGAKMLTGLTGNINNIRALTVPTWQWRTEIQALSAAKATFDPKSFIPHRGGSSVKISDQLLLQSTFDFQMLIMQMLIEAHAQGINNIVFNGSGTNEPLGIFNDGDITELDFGVNGAELDWAQLVGFETALDNANANRGNLAYIGNSKITGYLKTTPKIGTTFPTFMYDNNMVDSPVNNHRYLSTNAIPSNLEKGSSGAVCSALTYADWSKLWIGQWGGLNVIVNPYSDDDTGQIKLTASAFNDCGFVDPNCVTYYAGVKTA